MKRSRLAYSLLMLVLATACGGSEGESEGDASEGTATSSANTQGEESEGDTQAEGESGPASESSDTSMPDMGGEACQVEGEPCAFEEGLSCCDELFCETPEGADADECVTCRPLGAECYGNDECCSGVCSSEGQSGGKLLEMCM